MNSFITSSIETLAARERVHMNNRIERIDKRTPLYEGIPGDDNNEWDNMLKIAEIKKQMNNLPNTTLARRQVQRNAMQILIGAGVLYAGYAYFIHK